MLDGSEQRPQFTHIDLDRVGLTFDRPGRLRRGQLARRQLARARRSLSHGRRGRGLDLSSERELGAGLAPLHREPAVEAPQAVQEARISIMGLFTGIYGLMGLAWGLAWLRASFFPFVLFVFAVPFGSLAEPVT